MARTAARRRPRHDQGAGLPALHGLPEAGPSLRIPGYRIVRTLGQGGNASVFLASQAGHGRDVALKVLAPALTDDPERIAGFLREGQISAGLLHPNLAQVFAVGAHGGTCFLAAEYLPGGSLRARIGRGMGVGEALDCAVDVARGLDPDFDMWTTAEPVVSHSVEGAGQKSGLIVLVRERISQITRTTTGPATVRTEGAPTAPRRCA